MTGSAPIRRVGEASAKWLALACGAVLGTGVCAAPVPFENLRTGFVASERQIVDRNDVVLQRIRVDDKVRRGSWVSLDEVSPALIDAVLASEDKRFFEHGGVDVRAAAAAALTNLRAGSAVRGASSISMQVAAMLDRTLTRGGDGRTVEQKFDQVRAAWALESTWSKRQVLEAYLNTVYFRGEIQGIGAAAEYLFGKSAHGLDATESALLAALIRAPQAARAQIERRACDVMRSLDAKADCARLAFAIDRWGSAPQLRSAAESIAPHLARHLPVTGRNLRSTVDRELQLAARDAIAKHLQQLAGRNAHDAAVVVIDNASGEVLAYVGSSGRLSAAGEVDAARAPRQAGSTLKPFIYGLGIDRNLFTAATLLDDSPFSVDAGGGVYAPENYAHDFVGAVSVRTALASSLNVPAIRALALVGVAPSHALLRKAGLTTLVDDPDHYGYSLALGSADVSLLELSNAYRALANRGVWSPYAFACGGVQPGRCDTAAAKPVRLLSESTAWLIADMLSDRGARYLTFGFDNPLALSHWSGVKTGTSKDMRDNWTVGFNTRVTVGVWVGNASGAPMHNVTGISGAGPIWADVMEAAATRFGAGPEPVAPANLVKRRVQFAAASGSVEAGRDEWFLRGSEPSSGLVVAREASGVGARIVTPADGTIIALDPDIPAPHQRVQLKSGDVARAACWQVNDESLGCSAEPVTWTPVVGDAVVRLLDADGSERDRVLLTVRGGLRVEGATARLNAAGREPR